MVDKDKKIVVVGAGPSGLSMALFLSELGYRPKIIDKKKEISAYSKALGVNPRTLELFEPLGITKRFLDNGYKMSALNIWKGDKHIVKNDFRKVNHKYPFMLIQPQKDSEEILLEEVQKRDIEVEYSTELISMKKNDTSYSAVLRSNSQEHEIAYDYLVGADGGKSSVREQSDVQYEGLRYDEEWELYDVELDMDLDPNEGHVRFFPEGSVLMIRLYDNIWRVAGRMNALLNYMPKNSKIGRVFWESKFRIHHKIAKKLTWGNIAIIGDAAHLHSPVGARGMNLGIEDAFVLSSLIHNGQMDTFDHVRRPYIKQTVDGINSLTMIVAGDTKKAELFRKNIGVLKLIAPVAMPRARKFVLGIN